MHPFHLLTASVVYRSGQSVDGKGKWDPVPQVSAALDAAYDNAFSAAPSTGQRVYLAVDVSGSMHYNLVGKVRGSDRRQVCSGGDYDGGPAGAKPLHQDV